MIIIDLILITFIVVQIVDISGIITSIKKLVATFMNIKDYNRINLPLISCSYCVNWWISLIYIIIMGELTLFNIGFILLMSALTPIIVDITYTIQDILTKLINLINKL